MTAGVAPAGSLVRTRTGRALVLGLAAITMTVEMASLLIGESVSIGSLPLSASLIPSLVLLAALGARSVGAAGNSDRLLPFWLAMGAGMFLGVVLFSRTGDLADVVALLFAATNEEVVYRFAVPVVLTTALISVQIPSRVARVAAYGVAGVWWVLLPGHQAQTDGMGTLATYAAFAVISTLVVARSRALIPMAVAHCVLNVITMAYMRGDITAGSRSLLSACLLFLLIGAFAWPGDRVRRASDAAAEEDLVTDTVIDLRENVRSDEVIDLRDGARPSVRRGDELTWLDDDADVEAGTGSGEDGESEESVPARVRAGRRNDRPRF